ncbi:unnamed protein product [Gongylonema pulchrum]|uniref:Uncharacterized protein n=1 Tax=Gongylonema pulchrum TaxID=637853 RepID=A0A183EWT2_9BILA|nr:unnamed protein product [Gongylonema pulchrum]
MGIDDPRSTEETQREESRATVSLGAAARGTPPLYEWVMHRATDQSPPVGLGNGYESYGGTRTYCSNTQCSSLRMFKLCLFTENSTK